MAARGTAARGTAALALAALAMAALAMAAAGCGGAPSAAPKSYAAGPAGIDEALADIDAAERELGDRLGLALASGGGEPQPTTGPAQPGYGQPAQQGYPAQPYAQPPGQSPPPPPPAAPPPAEPLAAAPSAPPDRGSDEEAEEAEERAREDRCALACRALGSMRRAAEHVCRAAGGEDARCGRARGRVSAAEERVSETCDAC